MKLSTVVEAIIYFLRLLARADKGDGVALRKLSTVLPKRTHIAMAREIEKAKDRAKYGR